MNTLLMTEIILAVAIVLNIVLITIVATHNTKPAMHRALLLQMIGIEGWTIAIFSNIYFQSNLIEMYIFAFAAFFLTCQLWFVILFPKERRLIFIDRVMMSLTTAAGVFFTVTSFTPGAVFSAIEVTPAGYTIVYPGFMSGIYALFVLVSILLAIIILFVRYKTAQTPQTKLQGKYLLIGFIIFFIINLLTNSFLPVFFGIFFFNGIGPTFSLILAAFVILTIIKHQFMDIKVLVQRGLIYTALFGLIAIFYLTLVQIIRLFISNTYDIDLAAAIVTTTLGIFTVPKIDQYLRNKTDRFFYKGDYNYADALYSLSGTISKKLVLKDIIQQTEESLQKLFKSQQVLVTIFSTKNPQLQELVTAKNYTTLNIPIKLDRRIIGNIFLDTKLSGDVYTPRDIELLKTFSNQVAVALEKARLYKEVEDYSRELEARVAERTAKIEELQENQKQLLIDISHNLQNPLTIVKGRLGLIEEGLLPREELATFEQSIDDISSFIYDLLHLSRLEVQQHDIQKEPFPLSQLLEEHIEYYNVITKDIGIRLSSTIAADITINGNQDKIKELLSNLMSNAIKYIAKDAPQKEIRMSLTDTEHSVIFSIQDTGIGIHKDELPHIFKRFYRIKNKDGKRVSGTGLGLAICEKITDIHNGTIEAKSYYGVGTEFIVTLPK